MTTRFHPYPRTHRRPINVRVTSLCKASHADFPSQSTHGPLPNFNVVATAPQPRQSVAYSALVVAEDLGDTPEGHPLARLTIVREFILPSYPLHLTHNHWVQVVIHLSGRPTEWTVSVDVVQMIMVLTENEA